MAGERSGGLHLIDRDVDLLRIVGGSRRRPDRLADEQHRCLVMLSLADDDGGVDRQIVEHTAHRLEAYWSASWLSPRPMTRADAIAAASVTRIISRACTRSTGGLSCRGSPGRADR